MFRTGLPDLQARKTENESEKAEKGGKEHFQKRKKSGKWYHSANSHG